MTVTGIVRGGGAEGMLRGGLLLLVALGVAGSALALAYERHWSGPWQLAPWITLGLVSVAAAALLVRQTTATVRVARAVAVLAIVAAVIGVWRHVDANLDASPSGGHHATTSADDDAERTTSSSNHHGSSSSSNHHGSDEEDAATDEGSEDDEPAASDDPSFMDALTGSAGHAPVPAALAIAPVGLALALATIGLGGRRRPSRE